MIHTILLYRNARVSIQLPQVPRAGEMLLVPPNYFPNDCTALSFFTVKQVVWDLRTRGAELVLDEPIMA